MYVRVRVCENNNVFTFSEPDHLLAFVAQAS